MPSAQAGTFFVKLTDVHAVPAFAHCLMLCVGYDSSLVWCSLGWVPSVVFVFVFEVCSCMSLPLMCMHCIPRCGRVLVCISCGYCMRAGCSVGWTRYNWLILWVGWGHSCQIDSLNNVWMIHRNIPTYWLHSHGENVTGKHSAQAAGALSMCSSLEAWNEDLLLDRNGWWQHERGSLWADTPWDDAVGSIHCESNE